MYIRIITAALLIGAAMPASADIFTPSHSCSKPYKPYEFNSDWEVQRFRNEVDDYERCINDFVEEQEDAIRKHQDAAQDAIDEWNRYVRYELR